MIIALGFMTSCVVIEEQIKDVTQVPTQLEKPSANKSSTQESSESGQPETVNFASVAKKAKQGDAEAQNQLGLMYAKGKGVTQNYQQAFKWYQKAAEQGHAQAQFLLSISYIGGYGVTKNSQEGVKWLQKAAEQGHAEGQSLLGAMYDTGKGVTQNYQEAVKWLQKAAELSEHLSRYRALIKSLGFV